MSEHKRPLLTSDSENIVEVDYSDVMESSYIDYSMSVITDRAVPDLRDGLKPVQRRILWCMYSEGNTHDKPYRKTAKISGAVSGNYHPHGPASIEEAIVTMAQGFKKPVTLIDGQGNFGSVEGDGAAASRYTEVRLTPQSEDIYLRLLSCNAVTMTPNYDATLQEPEVLPDIVPMILLTGAEGIAVGMKTNIPTYNLSEVIDANIYYLTHTSTRIDNLLSLMPGPDFTTGGTICNKSDMKKLYDTGEGKIRIRGNCEFEPASGTLKDRLVITEVPYTLIGHSLVSFMSDIASLAESKELPGIYDIIDQTTDKIRIVLELNKGADVNLIKSVLYSRTKLEDNFSANMLVIEDGKPQTVGMLELFEYYTKFQKQIYRNRYQYDLDKLNNRKHILTCLITCIEDMDNVVSLIRSSKTVSEAKNRLQNKYNFDDAQVDSVLGMRMSRLVNLELENIRKELSSVESDILKHTDVLDNPDKLTRAIVSDLKKIKKQYSYERKTRIEDIDKQAVVKVEEPDVPVGIVMDRLGYIHQIDYSVYNNNTESIERDFRYHVISSSKGVISLFTDTGNLYRVKVSDVPSGKLRFKGKLVDTISDYDRKKESILCVIGDRSAGSESLTVITRNGLGKNLPLEQIEIRRRKSVYVTLEDRDKVLFAQCCEPCCLKIATSDNRFAVISCNRIKTLGRTHKGKGIIKFKSPNSHIDSVTIERDKNNVPDVYLMDKPGYGVKVTRSELENLI